MKSKIHVLLRVFAKLFANKVPELAEGTKTIKVNLLLFILFAVFAVPSARAIEVIDRNGQVTFPFCNDYKTVNVTSGVTSFVIEYPNIPTYNSTSCNGLLYVNVPSGKTLSFSGEVKLRNNNSLKIIDGVGSSAKTLYSESSSGSYTIAPVYTSGSSATVDFSNDGHIDTDNYIRLNVSVHTSHSLTVSVPWKQDKPWYYYQIWEREATTSGVYELNPINLYVGRKVYMKKNRNIDDLFIWGVNVKDANGNLLPIKDVNGNLVTSTHKDDYLQFEMPESDVVVVPAFYGDPSRGGYVKPYDVSRGWGYNMVNESRSGVKVDTSINVYDDGGIDYQYANNFDGYLTVNASKGHRLKVSGTVATETGGRDYLEIYEGRKGASATPICKVYSESMNVAVSVPDKCKSADSVLTLRFKTNGSNFADGLNLVVSAEVVTYNVTLNNDQTSYGTISSDKTISQPGYTVILTASPKSGYVLKSVSVVNMTTNATVVTSGGRETGNKITFTMPAANVKVTPTFVKDTYSISKSSTTGGTINVASSAKVGTTVSITGNPENGYLMRDIEVVAANDDAVEVNGGWFNDNKASFIMPLSNVTVKSSYTNNLTAAGGLYINMPTTGTVNATIPESVKSFKIYDDGGKDGNYSSDFNGTITLTAPEGYVLQVTGSVDLAKFDGLTGYAYDSLYIYDGSSINSDIIGSAREIKNDIGKKMSSGHSVTLQFKKHARSEVSSGLDLTVTLHKLNMNLKKDSYGNFYVDMLVGSAATLNIPEGVTSFKVYDDGGEDGNYSSDFNGILTLIAPEGYVLQVTGSVDLAKFDGLTGYAYDSLYIYDGSGINSDKIGSAREIKNDIGKNMSSGHSVTLQFKKHARSEVSSGLDLTVTLHKLNMNLKKDSYGNFYVDMLVRNATTLNIPEYVKSFKVYDDGGKNGDYSSDFDGILTLIAPEGYTLLVTGSVDLAYFVGFYTTSYDALYFYDGAGIESDELYSACESVNDIGRIYSFDRSMTLRFKKIAYSEISSGFNLTVTLVKQALNLLNGDNGSKFVNMPLKHKATLDIPENITSFKIYDNGGKSGDYDNNSNDNLVMKAPDGYRIRLTGTITSERDCDSLYVFDGENTTAIKLYGNSSTTTNTETNIGTIASTGEYMTLHFKSDAAHQYAGLDLTATLEKINYTITVNQNSGKKLNVKDKDTLGAEIYLTGSDLLSNVSVVDKDNKSVKVTTYSFDRARFTMPVSNVTVTPTWATDFTAEGGLHLDMQRNTKWNLSIPSKVKSFNLYDNGGKDYGYENNSNDTLTLTAPKGFYLMVTGSMTLDKGGDSLYIFDGENTGASKLFGSSNKVAGVVANMANAVISSGRSLTFRFKSNGSDTYSGLDLKVSVVPIPYAITVLNDNSQGAMTSDKEFATLDETVTLTATPADGYLFDGVSVEDDYGEIETLGEDIHWYSGVSENVVSFDMPASAVTVTPKFSAVNNLYVNMPKTGTVNVMIPLGVTSFKVYDDGGESGSYSNNSAGSLVLIAPEGYRLVLSGTVRLTGSSPSGIAPDDLTVYNGTNINSPILYSYSLHKTTTLTDIRSRWPSLMLHFTTDGSRVNDGLDLLVTVEPVFKAITIVNNEDSHGTMTSDKDVASPGETVTLTATPDEGYLFDGVEIKDADGQMVKLVSSFDSDGEPVSYMDSVHWYFNTNTAKFIMPSSAVTVTPVFTKLSDLYVNMPKSDTVVIHIPESVTSFKVYDDGGKGGNYSDGANGTLVLIPTDGWTLKVAGKAALVKGDVFRIQNAMMNTPKEGTPDLKYLDYLYESNSSLLGKEVNIEPLTVSQVAVMSLVSNDAGNDSGINLMVTKVKTVFGAVHVAYVKGDAFKELCKGCEKMAVIDGAYDGTDVISITDSIDVDTVVYSRKFSKNTYSTMVLPFSVKTKKVSGVDAVLYYNGIGKDKEGHDAVRMKVLWAADGVIKDDKDNPVVYEDTVMKANTPYLVLMNNETFVVKGGVTIEPTTNAVTKYDDWEWEFRGVWEYKKWKNGDKELGYAYGFAASSPKGSKIKVGDFVKIGEGTWISPLRAYLVSSNIPKSTSPVQGVRANGAYAKRPSVMQEKLPELMSIIIDGLGDGDNGTTVIGQFNTRTGEFMMNYDRGKFDLKGRRVNSEKMNARGAYYGKKTLKK